MIGPTETDVQRALEEVVRQSGELSRVLSVDPGANVPDSIAKFAGDVTQAANRTLATYKAINALPTEAGVPCRWLFFGLELRRSITKEFI